MANFVYGKAKQSILNGDINFITDQIKLIFVDSNYIPDMSLDQYVSDISISAIKYRSNNLNNVTTALGILDADDVSISDYPGDACEALIIYKDTGNDTTSSLIGYIDSSAGLPFTGSSSTIPIIIVWDNGPNKIIALTDS